MQQYLLGSVNTSTEQADISFNSAGYPIIRDKPHTQFTFNNAVHWL